MEFRQLECFLGVASELHFSRAANIIFEEAFALVLPENTRLRPKILQV